MTVLQAFLAVEPPTVTHNDLVVRTGRGGRPFVGKSDRLREAEGAILAAMARVRPAEPVGGRGEAVGVRVRLCYRPTGGHADGEPKTTRPDVDNVCKTLLDLMARAGVIADDAAVADLHASKAWSEPAGIWFRVSTL